MADYPTPGKSRVMIEYVLLAGVTDTPAELDGLARWARGLKCLVNMIPFNPWPGAPFATPDDDAVARAERWVSLRGVPVKVRVPRGRSVGAACGQLALHEPRAGSQ